MRDMTITISILLFFSYLFFLSTINVWLALFQNYYDKRFDSHLEYVPKKKVDGLNGVFFFYVLTFHYHVGFS